MEAHREAYREILRWTEEAAVAAEQEDMERLAECLRRRQELVEAVDRLPPLDPRQRNLLRKEILPVLEAALALNHGIITLLMARRVQLARRIGGGLSRFVDTWG